MKEKEVKGGGDERETKMADEERRKKEKDRNTNVGIQTLTSQLHSVFHHGRAIARLNSARETVISVAANACDARSHLCRHGNAIQVDGQAGDAPGARRVMHRRFRLIAAQDLNLGLRGGTAPDGNINAVVYRGEEAFWVGLALPVERY